MKRMWFVLDSIITVKELKEKVWKIEGVRIDSDVPDYIHVRDYPYTERLSDDKTVDDLKERIMESTKGCFSFIVKLSRRNK